MLYYTHNPGHLLFLPNIILNGQSHKLEGNYIYLHLGQHLEALVEAICGVDVDEHGVVSPVQTCYERPGSMRNVCSQHSVAARW